MAGGSYDPAMQGVLDSPCMNKDSPQYDIVRQHYLFSGLDEPDFDKLVATVTEEKLGKGEVLFHRCDAAH